MLIDTHCHIHETDYPLPADEVIERARRVGVGQIVCVGTSVDDSREAVDFAMLHDDVFAAVGVHPHHASQGAGQLADIVKTADKKKLVAIGEIGLDYHYDYCPRKNQAQILQEQIELALEFDLPIIFHVREAYDDFWPIFDNFHGIRGVLHCFSDIQANLDKALKRGMFIGVNGISTFTRDSAQKSMFVSIPLDRILLETDAPLLTPAPLRGKIRVNEPAFIREIADYNSSVHGISAKDLAGITTKNARSLFNL